METGYPERQLDKDEPEERPEEERGMAMVS